MALLRITRTKDGDAEVSGKGPGGGLKALVLLLIVLDLLAGGTYAYLSYVQGKKVDKERNSAQNKLFKIKKNSLQIAQAVGELSETRTEDVSDPQTPAISVAQKLNILEFMRIQQGTARRFSRSDVFEEHPVTITWLQKNGYKFRDFIGFHKDVEAMNPKIQVRRINLGKRDDTPENWWRPITTELRVFKPRLDGR